MNKFLVIFALVASLFAGTVKADSDVRLIYDNGNFAVAVERYSNHGYYNGYYRQPYNYYRSYGVPQPYYGQRYYRPYGYYNYPRNYRYSYQYEYNYRFDNRREYRHDRRHRNRWDR